MIEEIAQYNAKQSEEDQQICDLLATEISQALPDAENKIWHGHPVWFLNENPIVGYSKLKTCIRLLFWSGQSFEETNLKIEGTFKAAESRYTEASQVDLDELHRWLQKSRTIQWDYKNLRKRRGALERLL